MTVTLDAGVSRFFVQLNKLQTHPWVPSAQVCREIFVQLHISAWDSKLTQQPMALRALTEFGLLSYFQYLTQSITAQPQSQPHKPPQVIFDQPNL